MKSRIKIVAAILAGTMVGVTGYGSFIGFHRVYPSPSTSKPAEPSKETPGLSSVTEGSYPVLPSPEEAVYLSAAGIRGEVIRIGQARWSTPDGKAPLDFRPGVPLGRPFSIYRTATVRVDELLHGQASREVAVALIGGTADGMTLNVADSGAQVAVGDRVVMFLNTPPSATQLDPTNWVLVQSYVIIGDEARSDLMATLPMEQLVSRVKAESARRGDGALEPARRP